MDMTVKNQKIMNRNNGRKISEESHRESEG